MNYTVSCSGDVTCPPSFTTTDNTTRSYTITNLTLVTHYTFSVVATNSIGSGRAGEVMITTPPGKKLKSGISQLQAAYVYIVFKVDFCHNVFVFFLCLCIYLSICLCICVSTYVRIYVSILS